MAGIWPCVKGVVWLRLAMGNTLEDPAEGVRAQHDGMVARLADGLRQPGTPVETVQTHISTVLLAGEHAYKFKKPLRLPFLDFSTLAQREHFCREELRINQRTAPDLYLGVLPVRGTPESPRLGAADEIHGESVLDWVVHMRRFSPDALLAKQAAQGRLDAATVDALADHLAAFHLALPSAPLEVGVDKEVGDWAAESLDEVEAQPKRPASLTPDRLAALRSALLGRLKKQEGWRAQRRYDGWVREGHGDLHLGNAVLWQGRVMAFDAIEFDARLRSIDVMNDAAFAFMDLLAHGLPALAWRFINRYVENTGDYEGLAGLRAFAAYRAVVRAKVALLSGAGDEAFERYWQTAETLLAVAAPPRLMLTMGLSGTGKTAASQLLLEALAQQGEGVVRVRSDVERKRQFGLPAQTRLTREQTRELYAMKATLLTYGRLQRLAEVLLRAGWSVLLDAAFLRQDEREVMRQLARRLNVGFAVVECLAPPACLRERLEARQSQGMDASDATPAVVARQIGFAEPVPLSWGRVHWILLNDGSLADLQQAVIALLKRWAAGPPSDVATHVSGG